MRAPLWGAPASDLYAAALGMCAWAEDRGCLACVLCEHHCAEDGYLPSPLILASAIAARTERLMLSLVIILPFYDPGRLADDKLGVLRRLLVGEVVVRDGKRTHVTPNPHTPGGPVLMWGGASLAAARRAGRYGLGLLANGVVPGMQETYEAACRQHGHEPGPTLLPPRDTATVCFVADDLDRAWEEIGTYLLHDAMSYSEWNPDNAVSANISHAKTVDELRKTSPSHVILSVDEAASRAAAGEVLNLSPLCGGLPPELAWPYLH